MKLGFDTQNKEQFYQLVAGLVAVTFILIGCLVILAPFFPAILVATILTLSTWPAFVWLQRRLKNGQTLPALLMTFLLALCFIVPLIIISTSTAENFGKVYGIAEQSLEAGKTEEIAAFLSRAPLVGDMLSSSWQTLMTDREQLLKIMKEYAGSTTDMLISVSGTIGRGLLDLTLGVLISFFFFRHGTHVAVRVNALIETFGGKKGQEMLEVSKNTLIGVVYGILGTAFAQGALSALGFWIAGVPGASFLGLMVFFLSVTPIGPPLIWIPAALWLFSIDQLYMAIFLAAWGILVIGMVDNLLRPYFVSRGSNLPFLLVLLGIIGGMMAFGFIGIFIGPTLLALAYTLVISWSSARHAPHA